MTTHLPLASQVAGHGRLRTTEDGSLIIKPSIPVEREFYQAVVSEPALADLRPYLPTFYGTLKLEGTVDEQGQLNTGSAAENGQQDEDTDEFTFRVECCWF